ncbi:MAG: hypothetical protein J5818_05830, partial [Eggerthellaceae bacterium]|nr:hypothetical protein [Eggerthellaceae bacterium]
MSTAIMHRKKENGRRWARAVITSFAGVVVILLALLAMPAATARASSEVTLDDVMGIDRGQFVSSVEANWSSVYENTPYEGWYLSQQPYPTWNDGMFWPRGNPSPTGHVGMNCGGFVSRALTDAGADDYSSQYMADWWNGAPNAIDGYGAAAGQYANARTFWRLAKTYGLEMYTYSNKWDLLASGNAVKGDIIVMIDDYDTGGFDDYGRYHAHENDSHIGIFWGDAPDDDKFLHASHDIDATAESQISGCVLSTIQPKCWGSTFYLIKWRDYGGITLNKTSSLPNVSDGNALYSLSGAEYGVFDSRSSAETHDATNALKTLFTDTAGTWTTGRVMEPGTYYVAETAAPSGYALDGTVYEVSVSAGADAAVNGGAVFDTPQHEQPSCWALKRDAETSDGKAQGAAQLGGAKFEVRYFDEYYDSDSLPADSTRTWIVQTDSDGVAQANDSSRVSGAEFYHDADGKVIIPLGTIAVREIEAPSGYRLSDDKTYIATIEPNGSSPLSVSPFMAATVVDYVQRGGVATGKVDRQFDLPAEQGSATLEGATFEITSENSQTVVVDGVEYRKGSTVVEIKTAREDMGFIARTAADCLPVGSYSIKETDSSQGYLFDQDSRSWRATFTIEEDGQVADLTSPDVCVHNLVVRGDFEFSKVEEGSMERMQGIPFMLTSQTTGESHVVVSDENGMLSTAASWNPHSQNTNANDCAVCFAATDVETAQIDQESSKLVGKVSVEESSTEEAPDVPSPQIGEMGNEDSQVIHDEEPGSPEIVVDESKLDPSAGIWFNGRSDMTCDPDDELGALPFDTYIVTELPVSANKEHELVSFT